MQTASEWLDTNPLKGDFGDVERIQARERAIRRDERRQALVDAAKAVCYSCRIELPETAIRAPIRNHCGGGSASMVCFAGPIWKLLAKLDAEVNDD